MKYIDFLAKMSDHSKGITLKDSSSKVYDTLKEDIINPSFISDLMEPYKIEIMQA